MKTEIFDGKTLNPKEVAYAAKIFMSAFDIEYDTEAFDKYYNGCVNTINNFMEAGMKDEFKSMVEDEPKMVDDAIEYMEQFQPVLEKYNYGETTVVEENTVEEEADKTEENAVEEKTDKNEEEE